LGKKEALPGLQINDADDLFEEEDLIEVQDLEELNVEEFQMI